VRYCDCWRGNEDDNPAFTQGIQGSVAVLAGLNEGILLGESFPECYPSGRMKFYLARRDQLKAAILKEFYEASCNCWGLNATVDKDQPLRGAAWFLWPAEVVPLQSKEALIQAEEIWKNIASFVSRVPGVYGYIAEVANILATVWGKNGNIHKDRLESILEMLAEGATSGTYHFSEFYRISSTGEITMINDIPHVWEGVLFYNLAYQLESWS